MDMVLVDTSVLLDDPDVINRIRNKGGMPVLVGTVINELDYNKNGNESINRNARYIFKELNKANSTELHALPSGRPAISGDYVRLYTYNSGPVCIVNRRTFKDRTNNDGRIIELAQDYGMVLLTRDAAMKVRAESLGIQAALWQRPAPNESRQSPPRQDGLGKQSGRGPANSSSLIPFGLPSTPITETDTPLKASTFPKEGSQITLNSGQIMTLGALVSAGGEGSIYKVVNKDLVCKIYHPNNLTTLRKRKIELMTTRKIRRSGLCWPSDTVKNEKGEFVGYIMPMAEGKTVQSSMFIKPVLEKEYPQWKRQDIVKLCVAFLKHVRFLHGQNIIIGDINPMNLLVSADSSAMGMVDTDSFQIESFPCAVGTVNFTAPELQGKSYSTFLRTKDHELFAVATMLFMLLHPGKPPYSQQGGGSPSDNIKKMDFPYRFRKDDDQFGGKNVPHGPWQMIWSNLPYMVKEAFNRTFRENNRVTIEEWMRIMYRYEQFIQEGKTTNEIFPVAFKILDPIEVDCGKCGTRFTASEQAVDRAAQRGRKAWCPECANRSRLERLARESTREFTSPETVKPRPTPPPIQPARHITSAIGTGSTPIPASQILTPSLSSLISSLLKTLK